ncbi:hypothetical protein RJP21_06795 [Paenibacillus sp. VCA1]|uniref:hypothetical protein n=1 Tax=Paenibacillus sp. VCA1 TaxID=3039148 RepID=UPI0028727300|nr:hypothetical protein [Paenibacillus sp. VCA1]MDR9853299.1 hypothetical protein [Paenibacillus sp. VCA1]
MKTKIKILLFLFNAVLVYLLIILVNSEFQNHHKTNPETLSVSSTSSENKSILSILKDEYEDLYTRSSLNSSYKEDQIIDSSKIEKDPGVLGNFDTISNVKSDLFVASGWLLTQKEKPDYIVFVNEKNMVIGAGVHGINRKGLSEALGKKDVDDNGWIGYIKISDKNMNIRALSKIRGEDEYIDLGVFNK